MIQLRIFATALPCPAAAIPASAPMPSTMLLSGKVCMTACLHTAANRPAPLPHPQSRRSAQMIFAIERLYKADPPRPADNCAGTTYMAPPGPDPPTAPGHDINHTQIRMRKYNASILISLMELNLFQVYEESSNMRSNRPAALRQLLTVLGDITLASRSRYARQAARMLCKCTPLLTDRACGLPTAAYPCIDGPTTADPSRL